MKIHIDFPWGGNLRLEHEPMGSDRFRGLCLLVVGGIYSNAARSIAEMCGLFGLLWLFVATAGIIGMIGAFMLQMEGDS